MFVIGLAVTALYLAAGVTVPLKYLTREHSGPSPPLATLRQVVQRVDEAHTTPWLSQCLPVSSATCVIIALSQF